MTDYAELPARDIERLARNIHAGGWAVENHHPIATLLGSCVAVCLCDTGVPVGGMNHFMLPKMSRNQHSAEDVMLAGDAAMENLLNNLLAAGAVRHRIQAKAFGGGTVIEGKGLGRGIGAQNVEFAKSWLTRERIPLVSSDFMGPWARKIILTPQSGEVWCRRMVANLVSESIRREEEAYAESLKPQPTRSNVELF